MEIHLTCNKVHAVSNYGCYYFHLILNFRIFRILCVFFMLLGRLKLFFLEKQVRYLAQVTQRKHMYTFRNVYKQKNKSFT